MGVVEEEKLVDCWRLALEGEEGGRGTWRFALGPSPVERLVMHHWSSLCKSNPYLRVH